MIDPLVLSLHGSLVELALRVTRIERCVNVPDAPRAIFPRVAEPPPVAEPCSCDEALTLRAQLQSLLAQLDEVTR